MIMQIKYFCISLKIFQKITSKFPPELGEFVREIANSLDQKNKSESVPKKILLPEEMDETVATVIHKNY